MRRGLIIEFVRPEPSVHNKPSWVNRFPFFYGWIILVVSALGIFVSGPGQTYVVSIFVDSFIEDLGMSRTLVSGLYTAGSLTAAVGVIVVGRLLDRYGGRTVLTAVAILFGLAALWMSRVSEPIHLFVGFMAIRALGQGSLTMVSTTLVSIWFVRKRGRAIALTSLASPLSQAAFPPLVFLLIANLGWRNAWVVLAFVIWGALLAPFALLLRRSPEAVGLRPDGDPAPVRDSAGRTQTSIIQQEDEWTLSEAMRTLTFWMLLFSGLSMSLVGTALAFHHVSLLGSKGLDAGLAAAVLGFIAPMALIGTFTAGFLADRIPGRYVLAGAQVIFVLGMLWTTVISAPWHAFVYGGALGLSQGLLMTTSVVIWPSYFGRKHLGSIRGVATTAMVASSALGPLPFGILFDLTGDYNSAILGFLGLPIACGLAALLALPPRKRLKVDLPSESPSH